jgi:hypothetical protein
VVALGALAWALLACYPNPAIFLRSLARYRHFPVDSRLAARMKWCMPASPREIELFTQSLLTPDTDWSLYRVPWYLPTPMEAVSAERGDCEARAVVLASLLAGKGIRYGIRASFTHIWVDYAGRPAGKGETSDLAYLQGEEGRWRLGWPRQVPWREVLASQKEQLWDAMPAARKAILLCGWLWLALAALLARGPGPEGQLASDWRAPAWPWVGRALTLSTFTLAAITGAALWQQRALLVPWTVTDLKEVVAFSLVAGAFLAWIAALRPERAVSVYADESAASSSRVPAAGSVAHRRRTWLSADWSLGPWQGRREIDAADVAGFELQASPGGLRPWLLFASLKSGGRLLLLRHRDEVAARAALRWLGQSVRVPVTVRAERAETRVEPEEITWNLRQRAARRPPREAVPSPAYSALEMRAAEGRWMLRYPPPAPGTGRLLFGCGVVPLLMALVATAALLRRPGLVGVWIGWVTATSLLALASYLAILLRGEILGRLSGASVEVGEGALCFHSPDGRVASVPLTDIESVEFGRLGETQTIAVVTPARVLHLHSLGAPEDSAWIRQVIEQAVTCAQA